MKDINNFSSILIQKNIHVLHFLILVCICFYVSLSLVCHTFNSLFYKIQNAIELHLKVPEKLGTAGCY
jgi:hypothetical protein